MASNFHNILGFLDIGLDGHLGLQVVSPVPIPEFPFWELVCVHPFAMGFGWKLKVLIDGVPSVVNGHVSRVSWPHLPIVPENATFVRDMLKGKHTCWMPRGTVFIQDSPSTCCLVGPISTNVDCKKFGFPMLNLIVQVATVQTTPSPGDYFFGVATLVLEKLMDKAMGKLFKWKPLAKLKDKAEAKVNKIAHKIAVRVTRKGLGYQAAKKLGMPFVKKKAAGLSSRALAGRAKTKGRELAEEALKKAGLDAKTPLEMAKKAFDYDPMRPLQSLMHRPDSDGKVPGVLPVRGFNPKKGLDGIPLYEKGHKGLQYVTGGD